MGEMDRFSGIDLKLANIERGIRVMGLNGKPLNSKSWILNNFIYLII
jgi:hypothetical protein